MLSKTVKASDRKDRIIRGLVIFCIFLLGLVFHAQYLLATVPKEFECHFPPDLSKGGMVKVNEFQRHEVYAFAFKIFQQVYRCEDDCSIEFGGNVRKYGHYLTESYRHELKAIATRSESENRRTSRTISEYGIFKESKVIPLGNDTWVVYLDVNEKYYIGGKLVRNPIMRYPLIITKYDVDREKNPWRLGIDGLHSRATRIK